MEVSAFTFKGNSLLLQLKTVVEIMSAGGRAKVEALWDTGATETCISERVAQALSLIPVGRKQIKTPSGTTIANVYLIDIILPQGVIVKSVEATGTKIDEQGFDCLIGMNIIVLGDFAVSNYNHKTTFTFRIPSVKETDYVAQSQAQKAIGARHGQRPKGKR